MRTFLKRHIGLAAAGVLFLFPLIFFVYVLTDLRGHVESYMARALRRDMHIGELHVRWGVPLRVEMKDFHVGNAPWGSEPEMARFTAMQAVIDTRTLFSGNIRFLKLSFEKPEVFFERDENGVGNWKFLGTKPSKPVDAFNHKAESRPHFPVFLDLQITDGLFRMKTTGGAMLKLKADKMTISARDENSIVTTMLKGAYNGSKAQVDVRGASYRDLQDAEKPYALQIDISSVNDHLSFDGTMTDPLNVDGARGVLDINAPVLADIMPMLGIDLTLRFPLEIAGNATRNGDHWLLEKIKGHVAKAPFGGTLQLNEGSRREPDAITAKLDFTKVDLRPILDGIGNGGPTKSSDLDSLSLSRSPMPGLVLEAQLKAEEVHYDAAHISDVKLELKTTPSLIDVPVLSFNIAEGKATMTATLDATGDIPHLSSIMSLNHAEIGHAIRLTGEETSPVSGPFNARATLDMRGKDVLSALQNSEGGAVVYMNSGLVKRSFLEKASFDLRTLFRKKKGDAEISCMVAIYNMHNGTGSVLPLNLNTSGIDLTGGGTISLLTRQVDITLKSKPDTSSSYALDLPIRFSGPFRSIGVGPAPGTEMPRVQDRAPVTLEPDLQAVAAQSECIK